jgi:hypothetical protein
MAFLHKVTADVNPGVTEIDVTDGEIDGGARIIGVYLEPLDPTIELQQFSPNTGGNLNRVVGWHIRVNNTDVGDHFVVINVLYDLVN